MDARSGRLLGQAEAALWAWEDTEYAVFLDRAIGALTELRSVGWPKIQLAETPVDGKYANSRHLQPESARTGARLDVPVVNTVSVDTAESDALIDQFAAMNRGVPEADHVVLPTQEQVDAAADRYAALNFGRFPPGYTRGGSSQLSDPMPPILADGSPLTCGSTAPPTAVAEPVTAQPVRTPGEDLLNPVGSVVVVEVDGRGVASNASPWMRSGNAPPWRRGCIEGVRLAVGSKVNCYDGEQWWEATVLNVDGVGRSWWLSCSPPMKRSRATVGEG